MSNSNDNLVLVGVVEGVEIYFNKNADRFEATPKSVRVTAPSFSEITKKVERAMEKKAAARVRPDYPVLVIHDGEVVEGRFRGADLAKNVWILVDADGKRIASLGLHGGYRLVKKGVEGKEAAEALLKVQRVSEELRQAEKRLNELTANTGDVLPSYMLSGVDADEVVEVEQRALERLKEKF
jgi:hypothetical protein